MLWVKGAYLYTGCIVRYIYIHMGFLSFWVYWIGVQSLFWNSNTSLCCYCIVLSYIFSIITTKCHYVKFSMPQNRNRIAIYEFFEICLLPEERSLILDTCPEKLNIYLLMMFHFTFWFHWLWLFSNVKLVFHSSLKQLSGLLDVVSWRKNKAYFKKYRADFFHWKNKSVPNQTMNSTSIFSFLILFIDIVWYFRLPVFSRQRYRSINCFCTRQSSEQYYVPQNYLMLNFCLS